MGTGQLGEEAGSEAGPLKVRAFFGLPLPAKHRHALERYVAECAALAPDFRWTPADNLHLTVRFLGQVEASLAAGIADRVAATRPRALELELGDTGTFKQGRLARVIWLGLRAGEAQIAPLAALVEAESVRAGLEAEGRRFHAHLTLARARPRDGAALPELPPPPALDPWKADQLVLYRSRLGRGGSVYEPLRAISLR